MKNKPLKIVVLMGGWSSEREVSLTSGAGIVKALQELGHAVRAVDVQRDIEGLTRAILHDVSGKPDVIFNALHGRYVEDGCIQGVLEFIGIPYTHSGVLASAVCMDKPTAKLVVANAGVRVADGKVMSREQIIKDGLPFPAPLVIKPINEGSSVGVRIVRQGENYDVTAEGWVYGPEVLIEKFIPGRELTVGILSGKALTVTEIKPTTDFYNYTTKYTAGFATHECPAKLPKPVMDECMRMAEVSFRVLGCSGAARIDVRYDESKPGTEGLYFLEMNTQPGFTSLSLLPEQAQALGMSYAELCQWIVEHPTSPG
jgi:D-alanine-D-alanine ligase